MKPTTNRRRCGSNATDKKVIIKRRADGVYDIYVDDTFVTSKGSASSAASFVKGVFMEDATVESINQCGTTGRVYSAD